MKNYIKLQIIRIKSAIHYLRFFREEYPDMDSKTRIEKATEYVNNDIGRFKRIHSKKGPKS